MTEVTGADVEGPIGAQENPRTPVHHLWMQND